MAQIFVLSGTDVGRSFEVKNGDTIGRSTDCIVTLKDASISRRHAHLERMHNEWFIVDDHSRNGVSIDGVRVPRGELHDMSEFKVGELLLRFRFSAPTSEASAAPIAAAPAPVVVKSPPPAPVDDDEIVLEGADEEPLDVAAHVAPRASPPPQQPPSAAYDLGATRPAPRPPPKIELKSTMLDTSFGRAPTSAGATISRGKAGAGDRILQYSKVANRSGLANADLAQMSAAKRWTLYLIAFVIAAGLALVAFKGTAWVKALVSGDLAPEAPVDAEH
jgi:pSer/pThr/pTyr-binding forkhead associated (FHA) protein